MGGEEVVHIEAVQRARELPQVPEFYLLLSREMKGKGGIKGRIKAGYKKLLKGVDKGGGLKRFTMESIPPVST